MYFLLIALRLLHIVGGILWVGFAVFIPLYLTPALEESGPESGKVMAALQRRGIMTLMPAVALVTILSGLLLYWRVSGGRLDLFFRTPPGLVFALAGALAVVAYLLGIMVTRPAMLAAGEAMQAAGRATSDEERRRLVAIGGAMRARGGSAGRWGAGLLLLAAGGMATARYL